DFDKMEPFMEHIKLANCIDMETGPDGRLYLLEYGTGWFAKNADAGLSRIDYNGGNLAPKITAFSVDKTSGVLPFSISATVSASDVEKDKLSYIWNLGDGKTQTTETPQLNYTFKEAGDYKISVEVKDAKGASSKSDAVEVYAGNETPVVNIHLEGGNRTFYIPGVPVKYHVEVTDKNDTSKFDAANLFVSTEYVQGFDKAASPMGHQQGIASISGKQIMMSLDCKSCHKEAEKSIGPSFQQVSEKYQKDPNAMTYLTQKIIKGGSGVWGEVAMAAHSSLPQSDVQQIVQWVMSLASKAPAKKSLPQEGTITPAPQKPGTALVISASYTDKGGNNIKALTGSGSIVLQSNYLTFTGTERKDKFSSINYNGNNYMVLPLEKGWFALDNIDLSYVNSLSLMAGWQDPPAYGFDFKIVLDDLNGKVIGTGSLQPAAKNQNQGMANMQLQPVNDGKY
ncbi:MAG TPA: PKD domain-containing protein, partial [Chitinophagaceae bacterium]|nr:PKD domain-containing protein [Chitinophagaceae bacterium]